MRKLVVMMAIIAMGSVAKAQEYFWVSGYFCEDGTITAMGRNEGTMVFLLNGKVTTMPAESQNGIQNTPYRYDGAASNYFKQDLSQGKAYKVMINKNIQTGKNYLYITESQDATKSFNNVTFTSASYACPLTNEGVLTEANGKKTDVASSRLIIPNNCKLGDAWGAWGLKTCNGKTFSVYYILGSGNQLQVRP